jgi:DNA polymerase-3 subunit beta
VLQNVCIGDGKVTGANDDYRVDVELKAAEFAKVLLRKDRLTSIINTSKNLPHGDEVTLTVDGDCCVVEIGKGEWRLPTEDALTYPPGPAERLYAMLTMPADEFSRALRAVIYAIDKESSRYALGGVLIECVDDKTHFVATDGRRISTAQCERTGAQDDFVADPKGSQKRAPIVPKEPLSQLQAQCKGRSDLVTLSCGGGKFVGEIGDVVITSATIEGRFPNWRGLFEDADELGSPNVIDRQSLSQATRCAAVVATKESKGVLFRFGGETLTLTAKASTSGESKVECQVASAGKSAKVKIDPQFVTDFLKPFDSQDDDPNVRIFVQGNGDKTLFCVDSAYKAIIMPMAGDA